ncbi:MAG: NAD(P)-binding protein [Candidatus Margulisiibacteriota bacterium]
MYDYLVVGSGFAGSVLAQRLASVGKKVLVVEKRNHVGGNCFDFYDNAGILVHKYGPHIFHTNFKEVWEYLSRFTDWLPYEHRVLANFNGQVLTLPVNLNTLYALYEEHIASQVETKLISYFGPGQKVSILELRQNPRSLNG